LPKSKRVHLTFNLREITDSTLVLSKHLQIHFLQLHEVMKGNLNVLREVSLNLAHWSKILALGSKKSEVEKSVLVENDPRIMDAYHEFQRFQDDPIARDIARRRRMFELEWQTRIDDALKEGIKESKIKTVQQLKLLGVDYEVISKATDFSIKDIERL
jgi:predicted transposase/invertase (TIGR01784 family)